MNSRSGGIDDDKFKKVEKVFSLIHNFCAESLLTGNNLLEKHIEDLINPEYEVSPLLKYFNDLA